MLICIYVAVKSMVIRNQNVTIYIMFSYFLYLSKEVCKQDLEYFSTLEY